MPMFDEWAFQSWGRIIAGASVLAGLFLGLMLMTEEVVGGQARLTRPAITIAIAAFVGYVGTALIIRREGTSEGGRRGRPR